MYLYFAIFGQTLYFDYTTFESKYSYLFIPLHFVKPHVSFSFFFFLHESKNDVKTITTTIRAPHVIYCELLLVLLRDCGGHIDDGKDDTELTEHHSYLCELFVTEERKRFYCVLCLPKHNTVQDFTLTFIETHCVSFILVGLMTGNQMI